jgi:hypothetical protein
MSRSISVTLSPDIENAVRAISAAEGIPPEAIINKALRQHLFLRRFRSLRDRMAAKASQEGILKDEDVFERVS